MTNFAAVYVTRTGKEVTMPLVLDHARDKVFVQRDGVWIEFLDEIDSIHGPATWVETVPHDPAFRPEDRRTIRDLTRLGL